LAKDRDNIVRIFIIGIFLVAGTAISGCSSDVAKSIDKKISEYMGIPCSAENLSAGESYCSHPRPELVHEKIYCYKSLGARSCYREPNPYDNEKSERVRPVMAMESYGAEFMTAEEYELRQIMTSDSSVETTAKSD
jgi:hypothetical protein